VPLAPGRWRRVGRRRRCGGSLGARALRLGSRLAFVSAAGGGTRPRRVAPRARPLRRAVHRPRRKPVRRALVLRRARRARTPTTCTCTSSAPLSIGKAVLARTVKVARPVGGPKPAHDADSARPVHLGLARALGTRLDDEHLGVLRAATRVRVRVVATCGFDRDSRDRRRRRRAREVVGAGWAAAGDCDRRAVRDSPSRAGRLGDGGVRLAKNPLELAPALVERRGRRGERRRASGRRRRRLREGRVRDGGRGGRERGRRRPGRECVVPPDDESAGALGRRRVLADRVQLVLGQEACCMGVKKLVASAEVATTSERASVRPAKETHQPRCSPSPTLPTHPSPLPRARQTSSSRARAPPSRPLRPRPRAHAS